MVVGVASDGVIYMQADLDPQEEDTRPYSLQGIAEKVADGEAFAEVWYAYQQDMRTRPTLPLDRHLLDTLQRLDVSDDDVTPVLRRR
jgi:hypothetical protein